ncbi:MAG: DUF11 domain-containing protein, partial [Clostridia bacterium]|nr:DUF11 domain-containing protein [Clostridia bacterium]
GYKLGDEVSYKIVVTNDGNLTITDIEVTDERTGDSWKIDSLVPGDYKEYTAKTTVTEDDILSGHILNEATAKGTSPDTEKPDVPVTPGNTDDEPVKKNGHLTVEKETTSTAPADGYKLGDTITYKVTALNDGNLTITDITVTDELTGDTWTVDKLVPGESESFTCSYTVTEQDLLNGEVTNIAAVKGTSPDPEKPDVPSDPGSVTDETEPKNPELTVTKTSDKEGKIVKFEETITYTVTVENTGNLTITGLTLSDPLARGAKLDKTVLKPGEKATATYTYTVTQKDIEAGTVVNTAVVTGDDPEGKPTDDTATLTETTEEKGKDVTVTLTGGDFVYDGEEHGATVRVTGLPEGYTVQTADSDARVTDVDDGEVTATIDELVILDEQGRDVTDKLKITVEDATLKVTPAALIIVTDDGEKMYDGTVLTAEGTITGFVHGETATFTVTGEQTDAGESDNTYTLVFDQTAKESNYTVTDTVGTLTVTKRTVILTSGSARKAYDGEELTCETVIVSGDGFAPGEGMTYAVTGTLTEPGRTPNPFTYTLTEETKADNYDITVVYGTLEVYTPSKGHQLTVIYQDETGAEVGRLTGTYGEGEQYEVVTPKREGYVPDESRVTGVMGTEDVVVYVHYTEQTYKVTVHYVDPKTGAIVETKVVEDLHMGDTYEVWAPEGIKTEVDPVTGVMPGHDVTLYIPLVSPDEKGDGTIIIEDYDPSRGIGGLSMPEGDCFE